MNTPLFPPDKIPIKVEKIKSLKFIPDMEVNGEREGYISIEFMDRSFFSLQSKNLYRNQPWDMILRENKIEYIAMHGSFGQSVLKFDVWHNDDWECIWRSGNNFDTFEEAARSAKSYEEFIEKEGNSISRWIDEGLTYDNINRLIDDGHSGNTFGYAMSLGIKNAENRDNAKQILIAHNKEHGIDDPEEERVVNPAIMVMGEKNERVPLGPEDDDRTCSRFWDNPGLPTGIGSTPDEALKNLKKEVKEEKNDRYDVHD